MSSSTIKLLQAASGSAPYIEPGQQAYTTAGTYSWTAPADVTRVSVVCVGAGGAGSGYPSQGSGGGLGWKNNIPVVPGNSYTVVVGAVPNYTFSPTTSGDSYFIDTSTVAGLGGENQASNRTTSVGGGYVGDGGGNGGSSPYSSHSYSGGGGAGGYTGNGGNAGPASNTSTGNTQGTQPSGGGGGGGSGGRPIGGGGYAGGSGGGVGIFGQGANGNSPATPTSASARGGVDATAGSGGSNETYGGGASADSSKLGAGAVRIIWGTGRAFPSTNTGDL